MKYFAVFFPLLLLIIFGCELPNSITDDPITIPDEENNDDNDDDGEHSNPLDEPFIWTITEPTPPASLSGEYHHSKYDFSADVIYFNQSDSQFLSNSQMVISANGARIAVSEELENTIFLFSPENQGPILQIPMDSLCYLDITECGRGLLSYTTPEDGEENFKLSFFQTDSTEPIWEWSPNEYEQENMTDTLLGVNYLTAHFAKDGEHILCSYSGDGYYDSGNGYTKVLMFGTKKPEPLYEIVIENFDYPGLAVSADGRSILIITQMTEFGFAAIQHVYFYHDGELQWSDEVPLEKTGLNFPTYTTFSDYSGAMISEDGSFAVITGLSGQLIKYDTSTGNRLLTYYDTVTNPYGTVYQGLLRYPHVSSNGNQISAFSNLYYMGIPGNGIAYFNDSVTPTWTNSERVKAYLDFSPDFNPAPNGFEFFYYTGFLGFSGDQTGTSIPDALHNLHMSDDGNVMLLSQASGGPLYLFSEGSPLPFQILAEDDQPNNVSQFKNAVLSSNGAWIAGLAEDPSTNRLTLHIFEIPPGIIVDVSTPITLSVSGTAGEILDYASDVDEANITWHIVKPGRPVDINVEMNHTNLIDELFGGLNFPWEDTHRSRELSWGDGFVSETISMDWETPTNLSSAALALQTIVLRGELFSSSDVLLSQSYDEYLSLNVNISE